MKNTRKITLVSLLAVFVVAILTAICFAGCTDTDDGIKVRGKFYILEVAYENGWLGEDDLKSIACSYNDFQEKENPYSGMYEPPAEELSKDVENELKQAYLNQIAKYPEGLLENVRINYYYGTYNGNIVIRIYSDYLCIEPIEMEEYYIGNVVFKGNPNVETRVYHID